MQPSGSKLRDMWTPAARGRATMKANASLEATPQPGAQDLSFDEAAAFSLSQVPVLKKILVPVDFSHCSRRALQFAVSLAVDADAEVVLLHVCEKTPPSLKIFESIFAEKNFNEQALDDLDAWLGLVAGQCRAKAIFRAASSASREILNLAAQQEVDLIVMGRHSRSRFDRLLLGSTAEQVFRSAPCAVLVTAPATLTCWA